MKIVRGSEIEFVPASHEDPKDPGVLKRVLASRADLCDGRVQMVNWSRLPKGKSFQSHYHEDMLEVFIMLNGTVTMQVADESIKLAGGDAILIEPREIHSMTNACDEDVEYVVFGISRETGGKTVIVEQF